MNEETQGDPIIGTLLNPNDHAEMGDFSLGRAELAEGVGVFGSGYENGTMALVEGANSLGFGVVIVDTYGKFRPMINASAKNKPYLLGGHALNPFKPEGHDSECYVDLLCEALAHSFGTSLLTLSDMKGVLLEALNAEDREITLMGLASLFETQSEVGSQFTAYGALQPLLIGGSAAPFRGKQTINIGDLLNDVSVVELSDIWSKSLKVMAQSLLIVKIIDYARENGGRALIVVDSPEILWPDTGLQRPDARASFFYLQAPRMLKEAGVHLCICSTSSLWTERRIISNVGTLIQFGAPNPYSAEAASVLMGRKVGADAFRTLKTSFAYVLRPRGPEPELCRFKRPRWLFTEVSGEDMAQRNAQLGMPPANRQAKMKCKLVEDFDESADVVSGILNDLQTSGGHPFQDYSDRIGLEERRFVSKLLRLQYLKMVNTESEEGRQAILAMTEKGVRALREYNKGSGGEKSR